MMVGKAGDHNDWSDAVYCSGPEKTIQISVPLILGYRRKYY